MREYGARDMSFVVIPNSLESKSREEVRSVAEAAFPDILRSANARKPNAKLPPPKLKNK
jgi:hypothetical protein